MLLVSKKLVLGLGLTLMLAACATHREPQLPSWGGDVAPNPYVPPMPIEPVAPPPPPPQTVRQTTFSQGCTGNFSVRDIRTNREISSGRAFNSGQGLIVLDRAGRQVRALSSLGANTSVLFLPDCGCTGSNTTQTSMATPTSAQCNPS
jgi:hypothetical protein